MPDLSARSEIEVDLLSKLVLTCGDVSLVPFVKLGNRAIAAGWDALKSGCPIVTDILTVPASLDQTRLAHLGCSVKTLQPALVIGMPIGFSHAPAAKRKLMQSNVPFITVEGTLGDGLLAAVALNAIAESLIEKPDCHCYLEGS